MKGISGTQGGSEGSGIEVRTGGQLSPRQKGHCPFSEPHPTETQSKQASAISETPSSRLTLLALPWRSPETLPHPTYRPTQAAFPYEWLVFTHASQLPKSSKEATANLTEPPAPIFLAMWPQRGSSSSQRRFSVWVYLGISKPSTSSNYLRLLYSTGRGKQVGLTLACTTWDILDPAHPVDSYRPCWSTTTLPLHS